MADKNVRVGIILVCEECKNENYIYSKNKRTHTSRVEYLKYCPKCNKKTKHKEKK